MARKAGLCHIDYVARDRCHIHRVHDPDDSHFNQNANDLSKTYHACCTHLPRTDHLDSDVRCAPDAGILYIANLIRLTRAIHPARFIRLFRFVPFLRFLYLIYLVD